MVKCCSLEIRNCCRWEIFLFLLKHVLGECLVLLIIEDFSLCSSICIKIVNPLNLSYFSVLSHHKLSEALIHSWRNCQLDVSGCPTFHGPGDFPEHVVVCTTPDIVSFVFPLGGTDIFFSFRIHQNYVHSYYFFVNLTLHCFLETYCSILPCGKIGDHLVP